MNIVDILERVKLADAEFVPFLGLADTTKTLVGHETRYVFGSLISVQRIYLEDMTYETKKIRKRRESSDVQANKRTSQAQSSCVDERRLSTIDLQSCLAETC